MLRRHEIQERVGNALDGGGAVAAVAGSLLVAASFVTGDTSLSEVVPEGSPLLVGGLSTMTSGLGAHILGRHMSGR